MFATKQEIISTVMVLELLTSSPNMTLSNEVNQGDLSNIRHEVIEQKKPNLDHNRCSYPEMEEAYATDMLVTLSEKCSQSEIKIFLTNEQIRKELRFRRSPKIETYSSNKKSK